jgi:hypothetical protein
MGAAAFYLAPTYKTVSPGPPYAGPRGRKPKLEASLRTGPDGFSAVHKVLKQVG